MSELTENEVALMELDADNAQRSALLEAKGARMRNVQSGYTNYLLEAIIVRSGGTEALTEVQLGYSGVVSRMLDDAEKQVEQHQKVANLPKLALPGQPWGV